LTSKHPPSANSALSKQLANGPLARRIVRIYLLALISTLVVSGILLIRSGRDWGYGDWLINYEGGFVRRGLVGQICFLLGKLLHVNPLYVVAVIGISCYLIFFLIVWGLLENSSWRWWVYGLLICPATLAFPVISRTAYRKEILLFALLACLIAWLRKNGADKKKDNGLALTLSLALPALTLCHEPLVVYFPYCAAALFICLKSPGRVIKILLLPALLSGLMLALTLKNIGNMNVVTNICHSLGDSSISTCSAAVTALADTREKAKAGVDAYIRRYSYYQHYSIDFLLAIVPFCGAFLYFWRDPENHRSLLAVLGAAALSFPLSIDLFRYGVDWGRWINIHLVCIMLLFFLIDAMPKSNQVRPHPISRGSGKLKFAVALLLVAYATCWSMPGGRDKPLLGDLSLAERLLHWNGSLTS
jgi:hypothetical protein